MNRNIRFEVQFLLSTIIVVLGIIGVSNSERYVNNDVGVVFIIITTIHLLLLITYYAFNQLSKLKSPYLGKLKNWSENTLFIVSLSFVYFVFHIMVTAPPDFLGDCVRGYSSQRWTETVASYLNLLLPLIPTLAMGSAFWTIGLPTFRLSRNLSTNVLPDQLKVYPDYTDQRTPLMFEIKNEGSKEYELEVSIQLPEKVVIKNTRQNQEFVDSEFSKAITVDANSREDLQFVFRHDREQRETASVNFEISHSKGFLKESATLYLR